MFTTSLAATRPNRAKMIADYLNKEFVAFTRNPLILAGREEHEEAGLPWPDFYRDGQTGYISKYEVRITDQMHSAIGDYCRGYDAAAELGGIPKTHELDD